MIKIYIDLHVKYPVILDCFEWSLKFYNRFSKNYQISNFMKIRPEGAELLHANGRVDGQTNMTKLIVPVRNFANAPNNGVKS
jgi:hypothetical protein